MVFRHFLILSACLAEWIQAKGILVKFLPNPPDDSVVRYDVYRSESPGGMGVAVGEIRTGASQDTLRYPDVGAQKGRSYYYSMKAVNAAGLESDLSGQTRVGIPRLSLPDTLRPDAATRATRRTLPPEGHPLQGVEILAVAADADRILVSFEEGSRTLEFRSRSGRADTGRVILRASYFGKFEDRDTLIAIVPAAPTGRVPFLAGHAAGMVFPAFYAAGSSEPMVIARLPGPGRLEILTPMGRTVFRHGLRTDAETLRWNGRGSDGAFLPPSHYLLVVRDGRGRVVESGGFWLR